MTRQQMRKADAQRDFVPAISFYSGKVMHARMKPKTHRFSYKVFSLLLDLDRLEEADMASRLFSVNKANLASFHEKDHGARDGSHLRAFVDQLLLEGGVERPARVLLWCNPRIFGYTFNPLSIYYCLDGTGRLTTIIYQVHNTFGQSHHYVAQVAPQMVGTTTLRQSTPKRFYVSPFLDMGLRYDFRLSRPGDALRIRILEHDPDGPILAASFSGQRKSFNSRNLLLGIVGNLGLTWKIIAGIHFEALKLWLMGISLVPRPEPPVSATYLRSQNELADMKSGNN